MKHKRQLHPHVSRFRFQVSRRGLTLLETLMYAALVSFTIGFVLLAVYEMIGARYRALARVEIEEETNFLMRKITWLLGGVSAVNDPLANTTSTTLSVNKISFSPNPVVLQATSSNATISYGGGAAVRLNSASVLVRKLVFQHLPGGGNPGIKVNLEVEFVPRGQLTVYNATSSIETTIYARKQ